MTHTIASLLGVAVTVAADLWILRTRLLTRRSYWTAYAIVLFFQFLTNEWLTSRGVFIYGDTAIIGWRIGHAPVEDFLFGYSVVTQSMMWWVWWGRRGVQPEPGPGPIPGVARRLSGVRASAGSHD